MSETPPRIGAIDLLHYAPHAIRSASSAEDVRAIVSSDSGSLVSSLQAFLASPAATNIAKTFRLPVADDADEGLPPLNRSRFRLWELLHDVRATQTSAFLTAPAPTEPTILDISPWVECATDSPWVEIVDTVSDIAPNFLAGIHLLLQCPATGLTRHEIVSVDGRRILLENANVLADGNPVNIVGVEVSDPTRTLKVRAFHDWRAAGTSAPQTGSLSVFNEGLYRLLYAPSDPSIAALGVEELYAHYADRAGAVGSLDDLLDATSRAAGARESDHIQSRLTVDGGASIEFGGPMNGIVAGITTAERADEGYADDVNMDEDQLIPTASAVRKMIDRSVPEPDTERYTRYLEVQDVLYAGVEYDGVHCASRMTVDGEIRCLQMTCNGPVQAAEARFTETNVSGTLVAGEISARSLMVGNGALSVYEGGVNVSAPTLCARECICDGITVHGAGRFMEDVQATAIIAERANLSDSVICSEIETVGANVAGRLNVSGLVRASAIEVGGIDVVTELREIRSTIDSLARAVLALSPPATTFAGGSDSV